MVVVVAAAAADVGGGGGGGGGQGGVVVVVVVVVTVAVIVAVVVVVVVVVAAAVAAHMGFASVHFYATAQQHMFYVHFALAGAMKDTTLQGPLASVLAVLAAARRRRF